MRSTLLLKVPQIKASSNVARIMQLTKKGKTEGHAPVADAKNKSLTRLCCQQHGAPQAKGHCVGSRRLTRNFHILMRGSIKRLCSAGFNPHTHTHTHTHTHMFALRTLFAMTQGTQMRTKTRLLSFSTNLLHQDTHPKQQAVSNITGTVE